MRHSFYVFPSLPSPSIGAFLGATALHAFIHAGSRPFEAATKGVCSGYEITRSAFINAGCSAVATKKAHKGKRGEGLEDTKPPEDPLLVLIFWFLGDCQPPVLKAGRRQGFLRCGIYTHPCFGRRSRAGLLHADRHPAALSCRTVRHNLASVMAGRKRLP